MNPVNQDRWAALWHATGSAEVPTGWYERLQGAYGEAQRHYHTQQHISECLAEFDQARDLARNSVAIELAIWFHDVVYDPKAGDNEEKSAALANLCLAEAGSNTALAAVVTNLIIATKTHAAEADPDAGLMVDVDLSIFGQRKERFFEYEEQIRREYAWVPEPVFNSKRVEILRGFLHRKNIYWTEWFRTRYEQQARENLQRSIAKLTPS